MQGLGWGLAGALVGAAVGFGLGKFHEFYRLRRWMDVVELGGGDAAAAQYMQLAFDSDQVWYSLSDTGRSNLITR
jgi:hypothetical protein